MTMYLKRPGQDYGDPIGDSSDEGRYDGHCAEPDEWALYLPHQCMAWGIGWGGREDVLAEAREFRAKLDAAIATLENADAAQPYTDTTDGAPHA